MNILFTVSANLKPIFDEIAPKHITDPPPNLIVGTRHSLLYRSLALRPTKNVRDTKISSLFFFLWKKHSNESVLLQILDVCKCVLYEAKASSRSSDNSACRNEKKKSYCCQGDS